VALFNWVKESVLLQQMYYVNIKIH